MVEGNWFELTTSSGVSRRLRQPGLCTSRDLLRQQAGFLDHPIAGRRACVPFDRLERRTRARNAWRISCLAGADWFQL